MIDTDYVPSFPPSQEEWSERRACFDELWWDAMYAKATVTSHHVANMKWELERCFCSGSWIACIILSAALIEIHLSNLGGWKRGEAATMLKTLGVAEEWQELKDRRNALIHGSPGDAGNSRLSSQSYIAGRQKLRFDAEMAVGLALRVVLSDLRFESKA